MKRLKILIFGFYPPPVGGAEIKSYELACELVKKGHDVSVLKRSKSRRSIALESISTKYRPRGIQVKQVLHPELRRFKEAWTKRIEKDYIDKFQDLMSSFNPDIVLIQGGTYLLKVEEILKDINVPIVCVLRGSDVHQYLCSMNYNHKKESIIQTYNSADKLIAVSDYLKNLAEAEGVKNVKAIRNPIDLELFTPPTEKDLKKSRDLRKIHKIPQDAFVVAYVAGKLRHIKHPLTFLAATQGFKGRSGGIHFLMIGSGAKSFVKPIGEIGMLNKFTLIGLQSREKLVDYFHMTDAYVITSEEEGLPSTALEAMACGVPLITSAAGGLFELLKEKGRIGKEGRRAAIAFNVMASDSLAQAIKELRDNPQLKEELSKNGIDFVKSNFKTLDETTDAYLDVLCETIDNYNKA